MSTASQFDGNDDQIRAIIGQAVESTLMHRGTLHEDLESLEVRLDAKIDGKVDAAVTKMKFWVVTAVLTQLGAMLPVIFFLGGIYSTNNAALMILEKQQAEMDQREMWMSERERWEQGVEQWAGPRGFIPPRYRGDGR